MSVDEGGFLEAVIDRVAEILEVDPSDQYANPDGAIITIKEEIWTRLNSIKMLFGDPERFNDWVAPAKMRGLLREQYKKIFDALDVLRSLNGPNTGNTEAQKELNLTRKWLYDLSEINPALSARLIGYDVMAFDREFSTAIESLEKIEDYFSSVLARAESSVKGRGETKPKNIYSDHLLGSLCWLYRDVTREIPKASLHKDTGTARGNVIGFLCYILPELSYPYEKTHYALERKIRALKMHEIYGHIWLDAKR